MNARPESCASEGINGWRWWVLCREACLRAHSEVERECGQCLTRASCSSVYKNSSERCRLVAVCGTRRGCFDPTPRTGLASVTGHLAITSSGCEHNSVVSYTGAVVWCLTVYDRGRTFGIRFSLIFSPCWGRFENILFVCELVTNWETHLDDRLVTRITEHMPQD